MCAIERTRRLVQAGGEINRRVDAAKARLGALDFDDLIDKTLALFRRGDGDWVLYKLDRGIDHVLVDEAQDTNPAPMGDPAAASRPISRQDAARGAKESARCSRSAIPSSPSTAFRAPPRASSR